MSRTCVPHLGRLFRPVCHRGATAIPQTRCIGRQPALPAPRASRDLLANTANRRPQRSRLRLLDEAQADADGCQATMSPQRSLRDRVARPLLPFQSTDRIACLPVSLGGISRHSDVALTVLGVGASQ